MKKAWDWMTGEEREDAEERAAIMQYHGALTQERAEFLTLDRIYERRERQFAAQRRAQQRADTQQTIFLTQERRS